MLDPLLTDYPTHLELPLPPSVQESTPESPSHQLAAALTPFPQGKLTESISRIQATNNRC